MGLHLQVVARQRQVVAKVCRCHCRLTSDNFDIDVSMIFAGSGGSAGGVARMGECKKKVEREALNAVGLLEEALSILDQLDMPAEIGAPVDLALCRLRERLQLAHPPSHRSDAE